MYRVSPPDLARRPRSAPAVVEGENFPVAPRLLPGAVRGRLQALYRYARYVDDLGDKSAGERIPALEAVAVDVRRLYDGQAPQLAPVAGLGPLRRDCDVPADPFLRLVEANLRDQRVTRYPRFSDLLDYCALSATPVGEVVLHIFGQLTPDTLELSNRVCIALQLIEHWQDVAEDYASGRVYLPQDDLARFDVDERQLAAPRATPELVALIAFETDRALAWLNSGALLVPALHGWARLAVSAYIAGGRAAAAGLRRRGYDPLPGVPKPRPHQIAGQWLYAAVRRPG